MFDQFTLRLCAFGTITHHQIRRFCGDRRGNFAVLFGIILIVIVMIFGFAIDYSRTTAAKAQLDAAADSAVLEAIATSTINPSLTQSAQIAHSTSIAQNMFDGNQQVSDVKNVTKDVTVSVVNGTYQANLTYTATVPLYFGGLFGMPTTTIHGLATATTSQPPFVDIFMLVDASASMGIGATMSDINIMEATPNMDGRNAGMTGVSAIDNDSYCGSCHSATNANGDGKGCAIACHVQNSLSKPTVQLAHSAGATLRFDVVRTEVEKFITRAQALNDQASAAGINPRISMGVYSFGTYFQPEQAITSNLSSVLTAAQNMSLRDVGAGTNPYLALSALEAEINAKVTPGDGSTASKPLVYVIFATDAIADSFENTPVAIAQGNDGNVDPNVPGNQIEHYAHGWWIQNSTFEANLFDPHTVPASDVPSMDISGVNPKWCDMIKGSGASMVTLQLQYDISPTDLDPSNPNADGVKRFQYIHDTLLPQATGNMSACASAPTLAFQADTPSDIAAAMKKIFAASVTVRPMLTQ